MSDAVTVHEITIRRVYDAPRALVWKAWTSPEHLARWWGARGWTTPESRIEMDVRPGGTFSLTSISDEDGSEMPQRGVYREVVEPERIVFEEAAEDSWHEGAVSELTLTDLGDGRTEMVLRATVHTTDEARVQAEAGMTSAMDRLAEHLAS
jgi:uncharacterized protein YndB with AHSA1/START domain